MLVLVNISIKSSWLPQLPLSIPTAAPSPSPPAEYPQPAQRKPFRSVLTSPCYSIEDVNEIYVRDI